MRRITRFRPDFTRTATGYAFLDFLTLPYWRLKSKYQHYRFIRKARKHNISLPKVKR